MQVNYSHYEMLPSIKNENKNIQFGLLYHLTILLLGVSLEGMKSVCQGSSVFPMYFATLPNNQKWSVLICQWTKCDINAHSNIV